MSSIIKLLLLLACLIKLIFAIDIDDTTCSCSVGALEAIENLNSFNYRRIRIEYRDGLRKYSKINSKTMVECRSVVLYEKITDPTYGKVEQLCRTCTFNQTDSLWSELGKCGPVRCDKDLMIGNPLLNVEYGNQPAPEQQLFLPGKVTAIYKFGNEKRCKICQVDGEWSKYSETTLCNELTTPKPNAFCRQTTLKEEEKREPEYLRIRVESPDGLFSYNNFQNQVSAGSVAVYQRYSSGSVLIEDTRPATTNKYFGPASTAIKKYCRYCDDGAWSDIEPCVSLKCESNGLTGEPELYFVDNNLKVPSQQTLFIPYSVIAVYTFGGQRFCKQCHENGEWSRYSLGELCNKQLFGGTIPVTTPRTSTRKISLNDQNNVLSKNENSCSMSDLKRLDTEEFEYKMLYVVSPDRSSKVELTDRSNAPSRSYALYESNDKVSNKHFCRTCINGVWNEIGIDCWRGGLYFCEREKIQGSAVLKLPNNQQLSDKKNLFEPGTVMAVYEISEATKICKVCETNGEWSKYADAELCNNQRAFWQYYTNQVAESSRPKASCIVKNLDADDVPGYTRIGVETGDGKQRVTSNLASDGSIAIYQSDDPKKSIVMWCRLCENGQWQKKYSPCPQEFSVQKCDPMRLRGVSYFAKVADAVKLNEKEKTQLVYPGTIVAVYEFADQRYCKLCQEDGEWSRYQEISNCDKVNWETK